MTGATGNIYCGLHEFQDMAFAIHFLRPQDLFVDVGANVGSYSVLASGVAGCRSVSIEPAPRTFCCLERNLRYNDLLRISSPIQCAVGDVDGELRFSIDHDTMNRVVEESYDGKSLRVEVKTLDSILGNLLPNMWKVDVEGFEEQVLSGAHNSLAVESLMAVLLEANNSNIESTMKKAGFEQAVYLPFKRELSLKRKMNVATASQNQLWIRTPHLDFIQSRCREAAPVEIYNCRF